MQMPPQLDYGKLMHVHENANRVIDENAHCNAAMQINPG
jgi:hypothetical protein